MTASISGPTPEIFDLSSDGKRVFVSNEDDAVLSVIDVETREFLAVVDVGYEPEGFSLPLMTALHG
ncbi:hypothetical protein [Devosia ginsengisoli]|uniref:hypothetical protein n=1 Tax=Devosia ginsengisoli TaxID=400770 RepID=UPI0026E94114|nr:hypothetical protein [Devosia ginsengisoli]MCR6669786.1 hypothetical protein [Devosia ginsengisoli]